MGHIASDTLRIWVTRNCSKLRKIHSDQGPISLTINPSEFKFFGQFVLLGLKFSWCQLSRCQRCLSRLVPRPLGLVPAYVATIFAHDKYDKRPIYAVKACAKFALMTRKWNTTKWNFNHAENVHYNDVTMSAMASQITGVLIVCLNVCSVADQRKHQSSICHWPLLGEFTGDGWIPHTTGQ